MGFKSNVGLKKALESGNSCVLLSVVVLKLYYSIVEMKSNI